MAPELFKRLVNTVRSTVSQLKEPVDVYAFGTLIHEVLPWTVYANCKGSIH